MPIFRMVLWVVFTVISFAAGIKIKDFEMETNDVFKSNNPVHGCPSGYHLNNSSSRCYKLFLEAKTWSKASDTCLEDDAHLVTNGKVKVLKTLARHLRAHEVIASDIPYYRQYAFIGAQKWSHNDWRDVLGYPFKFHGNWAAGEPNNAEGKENCLAIDRYGYLNDYFCDKPAVFFCVKDLDPRYKETFY